MMDRQDVIIILLLVAVGLLLCSCHQRAEEGFKRSGLSQDCALQRSPVDYAYDPVANPHYQANPNDRAQNLDLVAHAPGASGVDLWQTGRAPGSGYLAGGQDDQGARCGDQNVWASQDYGSRRHLVERGDVRAATELGALPVHSDARKTNAVHRLSPEAVKQVHPPYGLHSRLGD